MHYTVYIGTLGALKRVLCPVHVIIVLDNVYYYSGDVCFLKVSAQHFTVHVVVYSSTSVF